MAAVVAGNAVGLGGNVAAAVYFEQTAELDSEASAASAAKHTADGDSSIRDGAATRARGWGWWYVCSRMTGD